ncbi:unnamed protein product [Gordionus sp. m RMFG-2023]
MLKRSTDDNLLEIDAQNYSSVDITKVEPHTTYMVSATPTNKMGSGKTQITVVKTKDYLYRLGASRGYTNIQEKMDKLKSKKRLKPTNIESTYDNRDQICEDYNYDYNYDYYSEIDVDQYYHPYYLYSDDFFYEDNNSIGNQIETNPAQPEQQITEIVTTDEQPSQYDIYSNEELCSSIDQTQIQYDQAQNQTDQTQIQNDQGQIQNDQTQNQDNINGYYDEFGYWHFYTPNNQ